jgi:hypothetical protein
MKKVKVTIEGTSPLLMNQYNVEAEIERQSGTKRISKRYDPKEEAEKAAYFSSKGKRELIIPAGVIYASILNASSFHKIGKRSAKAILAGSLRIQDLEGGEEIKLGTDKYEIDTRPVVIQRNRVLKSRARLDKWKATFYIIYNERLVADPKVIKTVLEEAGLRIGLMDFRPVKSGWYGCFEITEWKEPK